MLKCLNHPLTANLPAQYSGRSITTDFWLNLGPICTTTTPSASQFHCNLPFDDAGWNDMARIITVDTESGEIIEDLTLCDALPEEGSLVLQNRLEPWRAIVQADAFVTSRTEAAARPPVTLK